MGWNLDGTSEHEEWFDGGRRFVYKESVVGVGGFPFLLSLLVLFYCKASYDFEPPLTLVLTWFTRYKLRASSALFEISHLSFQYDLRPTPSITATMLTSINIVVASYMLQWYEWIVRCHLTAGRGIMIAYIQFRKLRRTEVWMVCLDSMPGVWNLAWLWQLIALFDAVLSYTELSTFCHFELHSWWIFVHIIYFQIPVLAAQMNKLFRVEISRIPKHWKLRPGWVSVVHGWAGVAGHLEESLYRICHLRFSLWSSTSFDRAQPSRSYFWISKQMSTHIT